MSSEKHNFVDPNHKSSGDISSDSSSPQKDFSKLSFTEEITTNVTKSPVHPKIFISGLMALILWLGTGIVIGCHMYTVVDLGYQIARVDTDEENSQVKVENIQKSISSVDNTAKSLYTFLTPFAAAITGFFFSEVIENSKRK